MRDLQKYASEYISGNFEQSYQVRYRRDQVLSILNAYPHSTLLEVGCGMDSIANYTETAAVTIVEPSEKFAKKAQSERKAQVYHSTLEDAVSNLKSMHFDFILVSSLLHEVEDPLSFLMCVNSLMDPETTVHINVPNADSFHRLLALESGMIRTTTEPSALNMRFQQKTVFSMQSLKKIIEQTAASSKKQLNILEEGSYFVKPFTHTQMEQCLESGILDENIMDGLNKMIKYMPLLGSEIYINYRLTEL